MRNVTTCLLLIFAVSLVAGCTTVDKNMAFRGVGESDDIPIQNRKAGEVYDTVLDVAREHFIPEIEDKENLYIRTYFKKGYNKQTRYETAEPYMRKLIVVIEDVGEGMAVMRMQVPSYVLKNGQITPTGYRDQVMHGAIRQQLLDRLGVEETQ